jgi:protein-L-isoaspartate(D-aspartate) O-methyltransferase
MTGASPVRGIGMTSQRTRDRMVTRLREQGIRDELVLRAFTAVPRHLFVDPALQSRAYEDVALPIGFEQTISQPYIVAKMLEVARAGRVLTKALEVGTGCGYQAALLAKLVTEAYSIERIGPLLERARANIKPLKITNLRFKHGDGFAGLPEAAPFDAIIVAAAAAEVPGALVDQLAEGGRMILPVGTVSQQLILVTRLAGVIAQTPLDPVRFVPMRSGRE